MGCRTKQRILYWGITRGRETLKEMFNILSHHRNANQIVPEITFYPIRMAKIKGSRNTKCWQGYGERGTLLHCWWDHNLVQPLLKSIWYFLRKLEVHLLEDWAIPLLGIYTKDAPPYHRGMCSTVFTVAFFVISRSCKQLKCLSMEKWTQKMWIQKCGSIIQCNTIHLLRTTSSHIL